MPNQYTADRVLPPKIRVRTPREPNGYRKQAGYRVYHFFLPIGLYQTLSLFVRGLEAEETRWFGKKHPRRTKNFHVAEALRAYLKYQGMTDPGLLEEEDRDRR
jgi:hypothetical protein